MGGRSAVFTRFLGDCWLAVLLGSRRALVVRQELHEWKCVHDDDD